MRAQTGVHRKRHRGNLAKWKAERPGDTACGCGASPRHSGRHDRNRYRRAPPRRQQRRPATPHPGGRRRRAPSNGGGDRARGACAGAHGANARCQGVDPARAARAGAAHPDGGPLRSGRGDPDPLRRAPRRCDTGTAGPWPTGHHLVLRFRRASPRRGRSPGSPSGSLYLTCPSLRETTPGPACPTCGSCRRRSIRRKTNPPSRCRRASAVTFRSWDQASTRIGTRSLRRGRGGSRTSRVRGPGWDAHQHDLPSGPASSLAGCAAGASPGDRGRRHLARRSGHLRPGRSTAVVLNRTWKVWAAAASRPVNLPGREHSLVRDATLRALKNNWSVSRSGRCRLARGDRRSGRPSRGWGGRTRWRTTRMRTASNYSCAGKSFPYTTV